MEKVRRILVATDFSSCSQEALDYAVNMTKELSGELYLAHVYQEPLTLPSAETFDVKKCMHVTEWRAKGNMVPEISQWMLDVREAQCKRLDVLVDSILAKLDVVNPIFKTGVPYVEILKIAEEIKPQLIVLGTHGRTGLAHFFLGSVAERVIRGAPCPVVTVKLPVVAGKASRNEVYGYWN